MLNQREAKKQSEEEQTDNIYLVSDSSQKKEGT